jgi:hypothetical protein
MKMQDLDRQNIRKYSCTATQQQLAGWQPHRFFRPEFLVINSGANLSRADSVIKN